MINFLLFILNAIILLWLSNRLASFCPAPTYSFHLLWTMLFFSCNIVIIAQLLSIFDFLNSIIAWFMIPLVIVFLIESFDQKKAIKFYNNITISDIVLKLKQMPFYIYGLGVLGFLFYVTAACFSFGFPEHYLGADAIGYHLPRVHFYLLQGSLAPYPTHEVRQIYFPYIAELHYCWAVLLGQSIVAVHLMQWFWLLMMVIGLWSIFSLFNLSTRHIIFLVLVWLCNPELMIQLLHLKNDLATCAYTLVAVAALLCFLKYDKGRHRLFLLFSLSISLAIGTKYSGLFPALGLGLVMAWVMVRSSSKIHCLQMCGVGITTLYILVIPTYQYLIIQQHAPTETYSSYFSILNPAKLTINLLRLGSESTDAISQVQLLVYQFTSIDMPDPRLWLFQGLSFIQFMNVFSPVGFLEGGPYSTVFQIGSNYAGITLGCVLLMGLGVYSILRHNRIHHVLCLLVAGCVAIISGCIVLTWQPLPMLRLFLPSMVLVYVISANMYLSKKTSIPVIEWLVLVLTGISVVTILINTWQPFFRYYDPDPFEFQYQRTIATDPGADEYLQINLQTRDYIKENMSPTATLALEGGIIAEYMITGSDFSTNILPIPAITDLAQIYYIFNEYPNVELIVITKPDEEILVHLPHRVIKQWLIAVHRDDITNQQLN